MSQIFDVLRKPQKKQKIQLSSNSVCDAIRDSTVTVQFDDLVHKFRTNHIKLEQTDRLRASYYVLAARCASAREILLADLLCIHLKLVATHLESSLSNLYEQKTVGIQPLPILDSLGLADIAPFFQIKIALIQQQEHIPMMCEVFELAAAELNQQSFQSIVRQIQSQPQKLTLICQSLSRRPRLAETLAHCPGLSFYIVRYLQQTIVRELLQNHDESIVLAVSLSEHYKDVPTQQDIISIASAVSVCVLISKGVDIDYEQWKDLDLVGTNRNLDGLPQSVLIIRQILVSVAQFLQTDNMVSFLSIEQKDEVLQAYINLRALL